MDNELYADTAQARALDRRLSGEGDAHWADHMTSAESAENNRIWLQSLRERDERQRVASRRAIAGALNKMEAMCGTGAAGRKA